jgi:hypothetical protein
MPSVSPRSPAARSWTTGGWQFDAGVSEDVEVDASPDIVFHIAARRGF